MAIRLGDTAPDFSADTTEGPIQFHEWIGDNWAVLFSHPKDYTPVCTTELGEVARIKGDFDKRGVKVIGLSVDPVDSHKGWAKDIEETQGTALRSFAQKVLNPTSALADDSKIAQRFIAGNGMPRS